MDYPAYAAATQAVGGAGDTAAVDFAFHPVFEGGPEGAEEAHGLDFAQLHAVGEAFAGAHGEGEDGDKAVSGHSHGLVGSAVWARSLR